jgi:hypothetical protein
MSLMQWERCQGQWRRNRVDSADWEAAKGVLRYLKATEEDGIVFEVNYMGLKAYCDADFAGDTGNPGQCASSSSTAGRWHEGAGISPRLTRFSPRQRELGTAICSVANCRSAESIRDALAVHALGQQFKIM